MRKGLRTVAVMAAATMTIAGCGGKQEVNGLNEAKAVENQQEQFSGQAYEDQTMENETEESETEESTEVDYSGMTEAITNDEIAVGSYEYPASIGQWVDVDSCYYDEDNRMHRGTSTSNDSSAHVYYRVTEVCNSNDSYELYKEYNDNNSGMLMEHPGDRDNKQWTAVKYEIYIPYTFSSCPTCSAYMGRLVDVYYPMDKNSYRVDKDMSYLDSAGLGLKTDDTTKVERGEYTSGYILVSTDVGVEADYLLGLYPHNLTETEDRLNHDDNDPGRYITIHVTAE